MARAYGSRSVAALAFETVYGTPAESGFVQMPFVSTSLGADQPLLDSELLGYGRDPQAPVRDAVTVNGDVVLPLDVDAVGHWLKALFGAPTTTGTTPKTHTFVSGASDLPSMSIEIGMPEVPRFAMYSGVKANTLQFTAQRSGLLQATVGLIAQGEVLDTETQAGSPSAITLQRFGHFNGSILRNGSALASIISAQATYSNNMDPVETIRNDGLIDGVDPTIASLRGQLVSRFDSETLFDQAASGEPCSLAFSWSLGANASLTLTAHAVYLPKPRVSITGPGGIQATFDWQAAKAASPARMCTAVLVNTVASYA